MQRTSIADCGEVFQLGYVAKDLERAMDFWTRRMGVGPFFLMENIAFEQVAYRGKRADIDITVAIAYWRDMQIELIRQNNDAPSIYSGWEGGSGVHHMCMVVEDIEATRDIFVRAGAEILQEGSLNAEFRFLYADTGGGPGTIIEAITLPEANRAAFEHMRAAARNWDGKDPVRKL